MTDKEYRDQKRRVQKFLNSWHDPMGMGWFKIDMIWNRERNIENPGTAAITTTHWQYRSATIEWFMPSIADNDDEFLENIVVHELTHILIAPLCVVDTSEDLPLQHEYATETLARAIIWSREAGQKDKK